MDDCDINPERPESISNDKPLYVHSRTTGEMVAECGGVCDGRERVGKICPPLCMVDFKGCHGEKDGRATYGWGK